VLAAGRVLGRPVPARAALAAALRRWPALAGFAVAQAAGSRERILVSTCRLPDCAAPAHSEHLGAAPSDEGLTSIVGMAVRAGVARDGLTVVAFRSPHGRTGLLHCAAVDCDDATTRWLSAPDHRQRGPALAVDRSGSPVLVLTEPSSGRVLLLRCPDGRCIRPERTRVLEPVAGAGALGLALDDRDRPRIAWSDYRMAGAPPRSFDDGSSVHVITCRNADCR
jgi:hypothetical protein